MEKKQIVKEMRWVQGELHYDSMLAVSCLGRRGGLAMLWNNDVDLHIQTKSLKMFKKKYKSCLDSQIKVTAR